MSCAICQNELDTELKKLPCGHEFHLECIKQIVRPFCPLCKTNITEFLESIDVSYNEIIKRINKDDLRISCEGLDQIDNEDFDDSDILALIYLAKEENPEWVYIYRDIIIDKVSNAEHLYSKISAEKIKSGNTGLFFYATQITTFINNSTYGFFTPMQWVNLDQLELEYPNLIEIAKSIVDRIKNVESDYGLLIVFCDDTVNKSIEDLTRIFDPFVSQNNDSDNDSDNELDNESDNELDNDSDNELDNEQIQVCGRLMSTDPEQKKIFAENSIGGGYVSGLTNYRPAHDDIVTSLRICKTCRHSGHTPGDTNLEYRWAKYYLDIMKKREKLKQIKQKQKQKEKEKNAQTNS